MKHIRRTFTVETSNPVFGWQNESAPFLTRIDALAYVEQRVKPYYSCDRWRIVERNEEVK